MFFKMLFRLARLPEEIHELRGEIEHLGHQIKRMEGIVAGELQALQANVAKNTDVVESAIVLLGNIKTLLDAAIASGDPKALQALSDTLGAENQKLADAIAENTPVE